MRFASKKELLESIEREHEVLRSLAAGIPERRYDERGVWGDGWTIKDLFAHLTEWEQMCIGWYQRGLEEADFPRPAEGYKWNQLPALNHSIWEKHRDTPWREVHSRFNASYQEILKLARRLSEEELFEPGRFAWTKKNGLVTYIGGNTVSHYRAAAGFLKRWLRGQRKAGSSPPRG